MKILPIYSTHIPGRGLVCLVESPVECERTLKGWTSSVGAFVTVEHATYRVRGLEMRSREGPIRKGEKIGLVLVEVPA